MADMINVYLYGKKYEVPSNLTIMEAFEYAGYQLVRGCGCRNGFCGACATIYRIKGKNELVGCLNVYEPVIEYAGAGASVPLLGFGNTLWKGVKEAIDQNGFLGTFMGGFKASAVGISAALIFGYLASIVFNPKMKK